MKVRVEEAGKGPVLAESRAADNRCAEAEILYDKGKRESE